MEDVVRALAIALAVYVALIVILIAAGRGALARELAALVPNLLLLFRGLLGDGRVPRRAKVVLVVATLWVASPFDLIPEFIPVAGPLDDAIVASLALRYVLRSTDRAVLREHWRGDPSTLDRILAITRA